MKLRVCSEVPLTPDQVREWRFYCEWEARQEKGGDVEVTYASIHPTTGKIYSLHIAFDCGDGWPYPFPICRPTVNVLTVFTDEQGRRSVAFVREYRPAMGRYVMANPAGGINDDETPEQAGVREPHEELGLPTLKCNLTLLRRVLSTPGLINEETWLFQADVQASAAEIRELDGKCTGVAEEGEKLVVYMVPIHELKEFVDEQIDDAKTLLALHSAGLL